MLLAAACGGDGLDAQSQREPPERFRALVFTKTTGFRHDSIPEGVAAIQRLGRRHAFEVDTTADAARFSPRNLARYDVVIFLQTTGTPIRRGGAARRARALHPQAAAATSASTPPPTRAATGRGTSAWSARASSAMTPASPSAPSPSRTATRPRPAASRPPGRAPTSGTSSAPRRRAHVLAQLDETRPLAWCHRYDGGRSVYTAMGHTKASYAEPRFVRPPARRDRDGRRPREVRLCALTACSRARA